MCFLKSWDLVKIYPVIATFTEKVRDKQDQLQNVRSLAHMNMKMQGLLLKRH